jgi:hypothetical protein
VALDFGGNNELALEILTADVPPFAEWTPSLCDGTLQESLLLASREEDRLIRGDFNNDPACMVCGGMFLTALSRARRGTEYLDFFSV